MEGGSYHSLVRLMAVMYLSMKREQLPNLLTGSYRENALSIALKSWHPYQEWDPLPMNEINFSIQMKALSTMQLNM